MPPAALFSFDLAVPMLASRDNAASTVFNHPPPPVLIGGLIALFLSGAVFMQAVMYFQRYRHDLPMMKAVVFAVWVLDILHSAMICTANWKLLILDYGAFASLDHIAWPIPITIALTAITTAIVHCFFIHRIYKLSRRNWFITVPLMILALLRVASAFVTAGQMIRLRSYVLFIQNYTYIFTLGLAISAILDILITGTLCYYLRKGRDGFARINHMIDILTLYTVESGMLTCIATAISLFFWLFSRSNFVFLGMHLAINKLYANSLLASLNARKSLATKVTGSDRHPLPVILPHPPTSRMSTQQHYSHLGHTASKPLQVNVDIERTIQHDDVLETETDSRHSLRADTSRKSGDALDVLKDQ
ncbi:hypothetical protein GSI_06892 [Ganoderma sinense ZZ0214-1]|uniref:DUF6534 domain-containing protein n=1 Tax=Ganoderma sinense ZZ0214-1 TaxID=1077348 RepID=A0A2G8SAE7_9APHY|nr:hypothetical protein GSI_06892 [Ganoderma sinense ZZ0214-1]